MINSIIFDIGGVLTDVNLMELLNSKGFFDDVADRIAKATFYSSEWKELDRGVLDHTEVIDMFVRHDPELEEEIQYMMSNLHGLLRLSSYTMDWIDSLRERGFSIYYLSNMFLQLCIDCADAFVFTSKMDGGIFSYKERIIKPDLEIYELMLSRYDLKADECIFIDDREINVEAAKKIGMHGIVFKSMEQAESEISKYNV